MCIMLVDGVLLRNTPLLPVQGEDNSVAGSTNNRTLSTQVMPKGLKQTSQIINIGFSTVESGANTFSESSIDLNLSPLDREVFVVLAVNLDPFTPDFVADTATQVSASVTSTSQTRVANLAESNCLAAAQNIIRNATGVGACAFQTLGLETPPATLDYIGIIATNDFFVQVEGANNTSGKAVFGKMYGYRAVADADIYAALVQSEVLSA